MVGTTGGGIDKINLLGKDIKMNRRFLSLCGLIAPILFIFTTILGGAIRPGYSHISNTISELFSPGSPNRVLLSTLHTLFTLLLVLFGIGILKFVQRYEKSKSIGILGALAFIAMGVLNMMTATIFPQDAWGSAPTFYGEMHIILHGVISILSILYIVLLGIWFHQTGVSPNFRMYSFATVVAVMLTAGWFMASVGSPIMGLTERLTALVGFQWTFILALLILNRE
jgi:hypothetical membrane protein